MQERTEYQRGTSKDISSTRIFGSNGKQNEEVNWTSRPPLPLFSYSTCLKENAEKLVSYSPENHRANDCQILETLHIQFRKSWEKNYDVLAGLVIRGGGPTLFLVKLIRDLS